MISRYSRAEITDVWSSNSKFKIWLDIELYACEAMEKLGTVPKGTSKKLDQKQRLMKRELIKLKKK